MDSRKLSTYLRLAAPLQSWATARVTGNIVRTENIPTYDGLRGLVAASFGVTRSEFKDWDLDLKFRIRVEKKGTIIDEFQTINPRDENRQFQERMHQILIGKKWMKSSTFTPDAQSMTSIVNRTYLSDAQFLIEIISKDSPEEISKALANPKFVPYLGRKAFAPTFPYYLGIGEAGLLNELPALNRLAVQRDRDDLEVKVKRQLFDEGEFETVKVQELKLEKWLERVGSVLSR